MGQRQTRLAAAGGVVDVVRHDHNGLLVSFGDVARLAGAIDQLPVDRAKAGRLGATGKELVTRGYDWDERFATLDRRVRELVGASKPQQRPRPHFTAGFAVRTEHAVRMAAGGRGRGNPD